MCALFYFLPNRTFAPPLNQPLCSPTCRSSHPTPTPPPHPTPTPVFADPRPRCFPLESAVFMRARPSSSVLDPILSLLQSCEARCAWHSLVGALERPSPCTYVSLPPARAATVCAVLCACTCTPGWWPNLTFSFPLHPALSTAKLSDNGTTADNEGEHHPTRQRANRRQNAPTSACPRTFRALSCYEVVRSFSFSDPGAARRLSAVFSGRLSAVFACAAECALRPLKLPRRNALTQWVAL